jgi:CO/xanthine dehydrogenase Mo-binding subunit
MTSLSAILAEELNVSVEQVKFVTATTKQVNVGSTGGSSTTPRVGRFVRAAAVTAYQALLGMASTRLGVPAASLTVKDGVVSGGGRTVTYGELIGDRRFNVEMPASYGMTTATVANRQVAGLANGQAPAKPVSQYAIVGTSVPRVDLPAKISGSYTYIHNLKIPGMLHGRVVLPRGQTAYGVTVPVLSVDRRSIAGIPGVRVVQRNNFVGVVASTEYDALRAAVQLKVQWGETPTSLPTTGNLVKHMRTQDSAPKSLARGAVPARYATSTGNVDAALASAAKVISRTYSWPYINRGLIGPSCAIADVKRDSALIFSNSKNPHDTLNTVSAALGLSPASVEVRFYEGASDYGWPPYNDAVVGAAVMSQEVGKPVRVQFMRWDEHGYENFAPPRVMDVRAGVDAQGNLVGWDTTAIGVPYYFYGPGDTVMQALGTRLPTEPHTSGQTPGAPSASQYRVSSVRALVKPLQNIDSGFMKTSYLRSPGGAASAFASEQMIDELAHASGIDPVEFRLRNLTTTDTDRWRTVIDAVTRAANWQPRVAASNLSNDEVVRGRGVGFVPSSGSFVAAIADVEVNKKTGKIVPKHLYLAIDAGLTVNPAGARSQVIGGAVQATSWTLVEQVPFDKRRVTGLDWVTYPILRIKDAPKATAIVIQRPELPATGIGEESQPATIGALANAFFDATGVRLREAPLSPARVRAALKAAGVA